MKCPFSFSEGKTYMIAAKGTKIYTKNGPKGTSLSPHPQKIKNPLSPPTSKFVG